MQRRIQRQLLARRRLIVERRFPINHGSLYRLCIDYGADGGDVDKTIDGHLISDFESLVDELMKPEPNENEVQFLMKKLDLKYDNDPINRISFVLEKMNHLVFETKKKKVDYDL